MRMIIGLLMTIAGGTFAHGEGSGEPRTELLTYAELTQLTSEKRIAYLRDVAKLLAIMEKQTEGKYELAGREDWRQRRSMIARLIDLADPVPVADAAEGDVVPAKAWKDVPRPTPENVQGVNPGPVKMPGSKSARVAGKSEAEAPANTAAKTTPAAPVAATKPTPKSTAPAEGTPDPSATAAATPGSSASPAAPAAASAEAPEKRVKRGRHVRPGAAKIAEKPAAKASPTDAKCEAKPRTCVAPKGAERDKLVNLFRRSPENERCIAGGFFTKKDASRKVGTCELNRDFYIAPTTFDPANPEAGKPKNMNCRARPNEVLCNPVLFCLQTPGASGAGGGSPRSVCVPKGPNITQECDARFEKIVKGGEVFAPSSKARAAKKGAAAADPQKLIACDPLQIEIQAVRNEYKLIKDETEKYYHDLCEKESTFSKLFCNECKIIGKHLKLTLDNVGHGCDKPSDTPPSPVTPTSDKSSTSS